MDYLLAYLFGGLTVWALYNRATVVSLWDKARTLFKGR